MKTIYAIRDRIAEDLAGYMPMATLYTFRTDFEAIRFFGDSLLTEKSSLSTHPSDYELIKCGTLAPNGHIIAHTPPEIIITGDALIAATNKPLALERQS